MILERFELVPSNVENVFRRPKLRNPRRIYDVATNVDGEVMPSCPNQSSGYCLVYHIIRCIDSAEITFQRPTHQILTSSMQLVVSVSQRNKNAGVDKHSPGAIIPRRDIRLSSSKSLSPPNASDSSGVSMRDHLLRQATP